MLYNLHFFPSKCRLFHNATLFGFCITHILNTGCAKIWKKKVRRQKVNTTFLYLPPLPGHTTWSYTVTSAVDRLIFFYQDSCGQFAKSLTLIINFSYFTVGINQEQHRNFCIYHYRVASVFQFFFPPHARVFPGIQLGCFRNTFPL
jgi:hypothetical protein